MNEVLGIDIGGVVLDFIPYTGTELDFHGDNYLQTPEIKGAIEAVAELNRTRFKDQTYIVSRYTGDGPARIIEWLKSKDFFRRTGIPEDHFNPCSSRHEKTPICVDLGITHFVDDRAEVLGHMIGKVKNLYLLKSSDADREEFAHILSHVHKVASWEDLLTELRK